MLLETIFYDEDEEEEEEEEGDMEKAIKSFLKK
jgi:hypothetical protein